MFFVFVPLEAMKLKKNAFDFPRLFLSFFITLGSPSFLSLPVITRGMQPPLLFSQARTHAHAHTQIYMYRKNKTPFPLSKPLVAFSPLSSGGNRVLFRRPRLHHLVNKHLKAHIRVVRARARLRVVLDAQRRLVLHDQARASAVVEVDVRDLDVGRQRGRVDGEVVVLGRDLDAARGLVADRVVASVVAELELEGGAVGEERERGERGEM